MSVRSVLTLIWFFVLLSNLILPSLFGVSEKMLGLIFFIIWILYLGITRANTMRGFLMALVTELFWGINVGILSLSFLLMVFLTLFINNFIQIQPMNRHRKNWSDWVGYFLLSAIFFVFGMFVFGFLGQLFYGLEWSWRYPVSIISSEDIWLYWGVFMMMVIVIVEFVTRVRSDF